MERSTIDWIALILVVVGGLNIALSSFGFDVLGMIFGSIAMLSNIVSWLIGLSAVYMLYGAFKK